MAGDTNLDHRTGGVATGPATISDPTRPIAMPAPHTKTPAEIRRAWLRIQLIKAIRAAQPARQGAR